MVRPAPAPLPRPCSPAPDAASGIRRLRAHVGCIRACTALAANDFGAPPLLGSRLSIAAPPSAPPLSPPPQVVCYIYFTRIIVYLLQSTLPYHYIWLAAAASELATLAFYIASGIAFRWGEGGLRGWVEGRKGAGWKAGGRARGAGGLAGAAGFPCSWQASWPVGSQPGPAPLGLRPWACATCLHPSQLLTWRCPGSVPCAAGLCQRAPTLTSS